MRSDREGAVAVPWSTRELADLAGTTVNAVRHYHQRGLLDLPERGSNGYKHYRVRHLVRLLQIRRLRDLGVPIAEIARHDATVVTSPDVLAAIDAELAEVIARSQRARDEIATMLRHGSTVEVASGFEGVASRLSPAERSLTLIFSRLYEPAALDDVRAMIEADDDPCPEFDDLTPDADDDTRGRLAGELAPSMARALRGYPWLSDPRGKLKGLPAETRATFVDSVRELYNAAQLDVIARASELARAAVAGPPEDDPAPS